MGSIKVEKDLSGIKGLCVITPALYGDSRGYFTETYSLRDLREEGIDTVFVQDNQSLSVRGALRGLHFQKEHPQAKLVRVVSGEVFDAAVDLRPGSPTFGRWHAEMLTGENRRQLLIPEGFAHGFLTLSETAVFCYKCGDFYHPGDEGGIIYSDPDIGIEWPFLPLVMSEKDKKWPAFAEAFPRR